MFSQNMVYFWGIVENSKKVKKRMLKFLIFEFSEKESKVLESHGLPE